MAAIGKKTLNEAMPAAKNYFLWDEVLVGFGLKVTPAGRKVYVYQYRLAEPGETGRTPARRVTIGTHGKMTPDQARKKAEALNSLVEKGVCPRQDKMDRDAAKEQARCDAEDRARQEGTLAFRRYSARWLDHYENEKGRRPSSVDLAKLVVKNYLTPALKEKPMPYIGRADIQPIIDAIPVSRRGIRRAVFAYASVLFGWAAKRGDILGNPLTDMAKPEAPEARDRVLSDDDLAKVWNASEALTVPLGQFFRLLILTGQRRSEVAAMNWSELDRTTATWTIPASRAKNGVAHIVPLSAMAIAELEQLAKVTLNDDEGAKVQNWPKAGPVLTTNHRTPIGGFSKAKKALDEAIEKAQLGDEQNNEAMPNWRVHDLRRTLATGFQRLGIRFEVTEATLNHVSGAKGGIAGIYQRHDWKDEKRSALDAWARHVAAILKPANRVNVVLLEAKKST